MQNFFDYFTFDTMQLSIDGKFVIKFNDCTVLKDMKANNKSVLRGQKFELVSIEDNCISFFDIDANSKFLISRFELNMIDVINKDPNSIQTFELTFKK